MHDDVDVHAVSEGKLGNDIDSWMTGINKNVGKSTRFIARYAGSNKQFRTAANEVRDKNYDTLKLQ